MMKYVSRDANVTQFYGACVQGDSMMLVTEYMEVCWGACRGGCRGGCQGGLGGILVCVADCAALMVSTVCTILRCC
jgi:hypothetical protein